MAATFFKNLIETLSNQISSDLSVEKEDVKESIDKVFKNCEIGDVKISSSKSESDKSNSAKSVSKTESNDDGKCSYVFPDSSKKKGQKCTTAGKHDHEGKNYCGTHYKMLTKEQPKKETKTTKTASKKSVDEKTEKLVEKVVEKKLMNVRKNKFGNYCDVENNIVIDRETKKALGNQLESGKIGPLTKEQIAFCEAENIIFDPPEKEKIAPPKITKTTKEEKSEDEMSFNDDDIDLSSIEFD